jgi:ABC-type dipeptide/oligopeptide/nickel transport system ATPase component
MGATGIEPMTSTVSILARSSILLIRPCSSCAVVPRFAWFSSANVPKLFPSSLAGHRQPVLIARAAILKPSILILDEATSALDNRTQAVVTRNLAGMKVTCILVAHRLSTIRNADQITS